MKPVFILLLLLVSGMALAVPPDYIVYYAKGSCTSIAPARALKRGDVLRASDAVMLGDRSELLLICKDYQLVRIAAKGRHKLEESAPCATQKNSLTASYFKYVWDELQSAHGSPEKNPRHYMRNKGAVSRAGCALVLTALNVDTIYQSAGDLLVYWKSGIADPYLSVFPDEHDPMPTHQEVLTPNKYFNLERLMRLVGEDSILYWSITEKQTQGCDRKYLRVLSREDYNSRVQALTGAVPVTTASQTAYVKGWVLEENHFLKEALTWYLEAVRLDPKNKQYQEALKHYHDIN